MINIQNMLGQSRPIIDGADKPFTQEETKFFEDKVVILSERLAEKSEYREVKLDKGQNPQHHHYIDITLLDDSIEMSKFRIFRDPYSKGFACQQLPVGVKQP